MYQMHSNVDSAGVEAEQVLIGSLLFVMVEATFPVRSVHDLKC